MVSQSQLEELRFLKAVFNEEMLVRDVHLDQLIQSDHTANDGATSAASFELHLALNSPSNTKPPELSLQCTLPADFPAARPTMRAQASWISTKGLEQLGRILEQGMEGADGIFDVAMAGKQWAEEFLSRQKPSGGESAKQSCPVLVRRFFWTHHTRKKQLLIYKWAAELKIGGRLTVSKPGYILVEGAAGDMKEFTRRNMAEKWKEIRVTWEEEIVGKVGQEVDQLRICPDGLREVSVKEFIEEIRQLGRSDILSAGTRGAV